MLCLIQLPGREWAGRSYIVSWFLHAQAQGPVCAVHAGKYALWLDLGAGAALYWPLAMQCHTETVTLNTTQTPLMNY